MKNEDLARRAGELVDLVEAFIKVFATIGRDLGSVPPLLATQPEEGSISLEWASPNFNVGFNVEENSEESGWHIAVSRTPGEEGGAYGYLTPDSAPDKVARLLATVIANS